MIKFLERPLFWIIITGIMLMPFLLLSFFCHPSADDFILSEVVRDNGYIEHYKQVYFEWSGRYFGTFIVSINPLVFNWLFGYKLLPVFLIILVLLAFYFLVLPLLENKNERYTTILIALSGVLLLLENMPSTSEGIYWMSGSLTYFLPSVLTLLLVGVLIRIIYFDIRSRFLSAASLLLPFIICGSNEVNMIFLLGFMSSIVLYRRFMKMETPGLLYLTLLCSIASSILLIAAPGNYHRIGAFAGSSDFQFSAYQAFISMAKITLIFFKNPAFLISTMLFISFTRRLRESETYIKIIGVSPFYVFIVIALILFSMYFFVAFSTGLKPALRIHNTVAFFFIPSCFYFIAVMHNYLLKRKKIIDIEVPSYIILLLAGAAIILTASNFSKEPGKELVPGGNVFHAAYDLFTSAAKYDKEMQQRYTLIDERKKQNILSVEVPELKEKPSTIFFIDISPDSSNWVNLGTASYFGIRSIRTTKNNENDIH